MLTRIIAMNAVYCIVQEVSKAAQQEATILGTIRRISIEKTRHEEDQGEDMDINQAARLRRRRKGSSSCRKVVRFV
jgi:hypothetical protein